MATVNNASNISFIVYDQQTIFNLQARQLLVIYGYPVIFFIGFVCNALNVCVLCQKPLRNHPSSICLIMTAFADSGVLLTSSTRYWLKMAFQVDWQVLSITSCQITLFLEYAASDISIWCLCVLTGQRFLSTHFPLKSKFICNNRNTMFLLGGMTLVMICKNSPIIKFSLIIMSPLTGALCNFLWSRDFYALFNWLDIVTKFLLPFPALVVMNILILIRIRQASHRRDTLVMNRLSISNSAGAPSNLNLLNVSVNQNNLGMLCGNTLTTRVLKKKEQRTTRRGDVHKMLRMVLSINLMFLICYMPFGLFMCIDACLSLLATAALRKDLALYTQYALIFQICVTLVHISHATNFFLYVASGKRFRDVLYATITCKTNTIRRDQTAATSAASRRRSSARSISIL